MAWQGTRLWRATMAALGGLLVAAVVGSVGFAIDSWQGLAWAIGGACAWATAFALGAHETGRPVSSWSLAGGLICGTAWALGWPIAHELELYQSVHSLVMTPGWALVWGVPAGVGGGLFGGIALAKRGTRLGLIVGVSLGVLAALSMVQDPVPVSGPWLAFPLLGAVGALAGVPIGLRIGRWSRPTLFVFEELWPYLREMTVPFAGFVAGYLVLVIAFAGLFGTLWRASAGRALTGVPADPSIMDFAHASIGIATGTGGGFVPLSTFAKLAVSVEAVFAQGWLIAVFAAVGAHLSPRFTRLAERRGGPSGAAEPAGGSSRSGARNPGDASVAGSNARPERSSGADHAAHKTTSSRTRRRRGKGHR